MRVRADDKGYKCQFEVYTEKKTKESKPSKDFSSSVGKEQTSKLEKNIKYMLITSFQIFI